MNVKYKDYGQGRLYVLPDSAVSKEIALKLCQMHGYNFYPRLSITDNELLMDCYNGYLQKKESIDKDSVCTVGQMFYDSLCFPETEIDIPTDDLVPVSKLSKKTEYDIRRSRIVFISGRGIGNRDNHERLRKLANKFDAALGCSRPIAMNGWESYDNTVGISGNLLSADIVLCFGVSGSGPFIKGIEKCKTVIAVNNKKDALIFNYADYAIIDDCVNVISYLEQV